MGMGVASEHRIAEIVLEKMGRSPLIESERALINSGCMPEKLYEILVVRECLDPTLCDPVETIEKRISIREQIKKYLAPYGYKIEW